MNVKALVEKKIKERKSEKDAVMRRQAQEQATRVRNERKRSIETLIGQFKYNAFSIDSTEDDVAEFIVNWPNGKQIHEKRLDHLDKEEDINKSKVFSEFRNSLEKKFGIKIRVIPRSVDESGPGDEGPDYVWKGYIVYVDC